MGVWVAFYLHSLKQKMQFSESVWNDVCMKLKIGERDAESIYEDVIVYRYSEHWRYYHTMDHIQDLLELCDNHVQLLDDPLAVRLAIFFHDIVYKPSSPDNEEASALLFEETFSPLNVDERLIEKVKLYIHATKNHSTTESNFNDSDLGYFLDMDMSILGAPSDRYDSYCQQIRSEYKSFSDQQFYRGRLQFLEKISRNEISVFSTEVFRNNLESNARSNLRRELTQITQKITQI